MIDLSIIIPTYNRKDYLQEAVSSCLKINKYNIEVIVIDDGSTDGTTTINWNDDRINFIKQDHKGANVARNMGLGVARGNYIKFLDDDDFLYPLAVEMQLAYMENKKADVSYGNWQYLNERRSPIKLELVKKDQIKDPLNSLLSFWSCAPFSYMFRKSILIDLKWDENLIGLQDFDFILKVAEKVKYFEYLNETIGVYRIHNFPSVMKRSPLIRAHNIITILDNAYMRYLKNNRISPEIKKNIAQGYYRTVRVLFQWDRTKFYEVVDKIYLYDQKFKPNIFYPYWEQFLVPKLGIKKIEFLLQLRRQLINFFTGYLKPIDELVKKDKTHLSKLK